MRPLVGKGVAVTRWLHLRQLRRQPLRVVLAVVALAAGVSLVTGVIIEVASFKAATTRFGRATAGAAPVRVVGAMARGGIDEAVVDRVGATSGVAAAAPVIQAVAMAGRPGRPEEFVVALGVDCRMAAMVGVVGCDPSALAAANDNGPPLTSTSLARRLGPGGVLRTDTGPVPLERAPAVARLDAVNQGRVVIFPIGVAQHRFARPARVDAIYVEPAAGVRVSDLRRRLQAVVGPQDAVLAATDAPAVLDAQGTLLPFLGVVALFALAVGGLLVGNIVSLSLAERRREFALATALGSTPRRLVTGIAAEAATLGLLGGLLGVPAGVAVARPMVTSVSHITERFTGLGVQVDVTATAILAGVLLGVAVAVVAAALPARRATRLDVAAELHGRDEWGLDPGGRPGLRALAFVTLSLIGVALTEIGAQRGGVDPWQAPMATVGVLLAITAVFGAVGAVAGIIFSALRRRLPAGRRLHLALAGLANQPRRTAGMVLAVAAAVGIGASMASGVPMIHDATVRFQSRTNHGRVGVNTLPFNNAAGIESKLSPSQLATLARVPGVAGVDREFFLDIGRHQKELVAVTASDRQIFPFPVVRGAPGPEVFRRGEVLVGVGLARLRHLHPGSLLQLPAPAGMVAMKVGAIWQSPDETGLSVTMPVTTLERGWGPLPADFVYARPAPGLSTDALAARIRVAGLGAHVRVETPAQLTDETSRSINAYLAPFWTLQRGLLLVTFIATLSTLLLVGIQRRRELATLAAVGLSPPGLGRLAVAEAAAVGGVGAVLGLLSALPGIEAVRNDAGILYGTRPPLHLNVPPALLYAAIGVAVVLLGALLPAWRAARLDVIDALTYE